MFGLEGGREKNLYPKDFDDAVIAMIESVHPYTMTTEEWLVGLIRLNCSVSVMKIGLSFTILFLFRNDLIDPGNCPTSSKN